MNVNTALLGVPPALLFGLLSFMILRGKRVSAIDFIVFFLFGFYLASTGIASFIDVLVRLIPDMISGGHG